MTKRLSYPIQVRQTTEPVDPLAPAPATPRQVQEYHDRLPFRSQGLTPLADRVRSLIVDHGCDHDLAQALAHGDVAWVRRAKAKGQGFR